MIKNKSLEQHGFTLMEVLVSISIFVLIALSSLSIYSAILKASQKTTVLVRVQREAQFIMAVLAKKIRTSRVDYSYNYNADGDPGINNEEDELALTDLLNDNYVFKQLGNSLAVSVNGGVDKIIPATNIQITDLQFYINPIENPFTSLDEPPSSQPYVTVVMTVSSTQTGQNDSLVVQQTVPQRSGGIIQP